MNEQNFPQSNKQTPNSVNIKVIIATIVITALIVGGGVYIWQKNKVSKINIQVQKTTSEQTKQTTNTKDQIQDLKKTTNKKSEIDKQVETTETKTDVKTPETKKDTSSLPAGVEWLTYSDDDLSFVYPKTFLGTPLQDPLDKNNGRSEWKVSRQKNTIYIRPTFESPAAEFGSTYEIEVINNYKDLKELQSIIQSGSLTKNFCITSKEIKLSGYTVCKFEQEVNEGLGRVGNFYAVRPEMKDGEQPLPWIYIFDQAKGVYSDYITSVLIPSLKIK